MSGYGLLDVGNSIKQQGTAGLRRAAAAEQQRNMQNENIKNAQDAQQKNTTATFVGYGAKQDYSRYLDGQEAIDANSLESVSPTYEGASGEFGQSQVGTDVGLDGVKHTQLDQSAVSTTPDVLEQATVDQFSKGAGKEAAVEAGKEVAVDAGKEVAVEAGKEVAVEAGKEVVTEAAADLAVDAAAEAAIETAATQAATQAAAVSTAGTGAAVGEAAAAGSTFGPWGAVAGIAASILINSLFD